MVGYYLANGYYLQDAAEVVNDRRICYHNVLFKIAFVDFELGWLSVADNADLLLESVIFRPYISRLQGCLDFHFLMIYSGAD